MPLRTYVHMLMKTCYDSARSLQGGYIPLPPIVLTAFLCAYAGFGLGETRRTGSDGARVSKQRGASGVSSRGGVSSVAGAGAGGSSGARNTPGPARRTKARPA